MRAERVYNRRASSRGCESGTNLAPRPPFPFLSEDGLGAGGRSASSKRSRAPISPPAPSARAPAILHPRGRRWLRVGDPAPGGGGAMGAGPDAGVIPARPGSAHWPGPRSSAGRRPPPPACRA